MSKFNEDVRTTFKSGKHEHRTMGYAEEPVPDPHNFLKKNQHAAKQNASNNSRVCIFFLCAF